MIYFLDNTYNAKSYFMKNFGKTNSEVDEFMGIDDSFDYYTRKFEFKQ